MITHFKKLYLTTFLKTPTIYSEEIQNACNIIYQYYEKSEKIIGYNPLLKETTFRECQELIPNYCVHFVTEQDGVQLDSIAISEINN